MFFFLCFFLPISVEQVHVCPKYHSLIESDDDDYNGGNNCKDEDRDDDDDGSKDGGIYDNYEINDSLRDHDNVDNDLYDDNEDNHIIATLLP